MKCKLPKSTLSSFVISSLRLSSGEIEFPYNQSWLHMTACIILGIRELL